VEGVEGVVKVDNRIVWEVTVEDRSSQWLAYPQEGATR